MTTIVVLSINGTPLRVECDGLARDQLLAKNVVLTGCKELDTEGRDGLPLDTKIWSVPESLVISYAVGKTRETEPAAAATVEVAPAIEVVQELTDEQKEARRRRYAASDALLSGKKPPAAKKPAAKKPAAPKK